MRPAIDIYREHVLPIPTRVLGRDLLPFTVGHALLFDRLGLVEINTAVDLMAAVLVCSMPAGEFERRSQSRWFSLRVFLWARRYRKHCANAEKLIGSLKVFAEYLDQHTTSPDYEIVHAAEEESCVPFVQHLRTVLLGRLNYSPKDINDTPYTQAIWDYASFFELDRSIRILDGKKGENHDARFADADANHARRVEQYLKSRQQ